MGELDYAAENRDDFDPVDDRPAAKGPNDVPFTQYLRPDGRPREVWVERSPEVVALAAKVREAGFHFDIEELMDHTVSMTVEPNEPDIDGNDGPIACELCPNGPDVPATVDRLITNAAARVLR